jgi:hypothetical protein
MVQDDTAAGYEAMMIMKLRSTMTSIWFHAGGKGAVLVNTNDGQTGAHQGYRLLDACRCLLLLLCCCHL